MRRIGGGLRAGRWAGTLALAALAAGFGLCGARFAAAQSPGEQADECMLCHEDPDLTLSFPDGSSRRLKVDRSAVEGSVHGKKLRCTDCHAGMDEVPHPERGYKSLEEYEAGFREVCKACHFANYARYLDSVHYRVLTQEHGPAPSCIDCHDYHAVAPPNKPRSHISDTCSGCHSDVADAYSQSVHGRALGGPGSDDVPVCTDCHRSHDVTNPRDAAFLLRTPDLCGRCHADKKLMEKYGISTNVLETYLSDFHGMTASLARGTATGEERVTAVCVDCHGAHDISRVDDPGSTVLKTNLVKTCQKCHEGASESFPAAWLSHFEPSLERAPLVYLTQWFYKLLIPFLIGGLVLQILLHLWRVVVNR